MQRMVELVPSRCLLAPAGAAAAPFCPWIEIAALVDVSVVEWAFADVFWLHWAVPVRDGRVDASAAVAFDPGRRSAYAGEPAEAERAEVYTLDRDSARGLWESLWNGSRPLLHHHVALGLTSGLGEPRSAFQRRCLRLMAPAGSAGLNEEQFAAAIAQLAAQIETRPLKESDLRVSRCRVGVGWYPHGVAPSLADPELLVKGAARPCQALGVKSGPAARQRWRAAIGCAALVARPGRRHRS
jgi:hypothetical protein